MVSVCAACSGKRARAAATGGCIAVRGVVQTEVCMTDLEPQVERAIDAICALGCTVVDAYIEALQKGDSRAEYEALEPGQRGVLLRELQAIMAVYNRDDD